MALKNFNEQTNPQNIGAKYTYYQVDEKNERKSGCRWLKCCNNLIELSFVIAL